MPNEASLDDADHPMAELLDACPDLRQLDVPLSHRPQIRRLLCESVFAARLLQLSILQATAQEVALLCNCTSLRRLHLARCSMQRLDLTLALPPSLSVLTITESEGVAATPPLERTRVHWANLHWLGVDCSPDLLTPSCRLEATRYAPHPLLLDLSNCDFTNPNPNPNPGMPPTCSFST